VTGGIRIGRLFGIEIAIHPSWFIILALFAFTLANGFFPNTYEDWSRLTAWIVAIIATVLLFATVLAHELGHSLVARRQGITVTGITLFLLGGVASIEKEAATPGREAVLAGVGPLVSIAIGAVCWGLSALLPGPEQVVAILYYLGIANVSLAIFNLLPGFPLDGGRVLRALLWWRNHSFERATKQATIVGQAFGVGLIVLGAVQILSGAGLGGLWLAFVGWILIQAARASASQAVLQHQLAGVPTASIMTRPSEWVSPYVTLSYAAEGHFTDFDTRCLPVRPEREDQSFDGLICGADLARMPRQEWDTDRVRDVMVPAEKLLTVTPETPADEALRLLARDDVDRLAVVDADGRLVGFVDDTAIARYAMLRKGQASAAAEA
jgi:Zn-dependent protease